MKRLFVTLVLITSFAAVQGQAQDARPEVGAVERLQKQATADYGGTERTLALTAPVFFEDTLRTGTGARLTSRFADDSLLTLGENAAMTVDAFIYNPDADTRTVALRSAAGAFLLAVETLGSSGETQVEVRTPLAVIGIRGTTVWGGEIDEGYGVLALDGSVTVTTDAGITTLQPGQGVTIVTASEPYPIAIWPPAKVARAVATIRYDEE